MSPTLALRTHVRLLRHGQRPLLYGYFASLLTTPLAWAALVAPHDRLALAERLANLLVIGLLSVSAVVIGTFAVGTFAFARGFGGELPPSLPGHRGLRLRAPLPAVLIGWGTSLVAWTLTNIYLFGFAPHVVIGSSACGLAVAFTVFAVAAWYESRALAQLRHAQGRALIDALVRLPDDAPPALVDALEAARAATAASADRHVQPHATDRAQLERLERVRDSLARQVHLALDTLAERLQLAPDTLTRLERQAIALHQSTASLGRDDDMALDNQLEELERVVEALHIEPQTTDPALAHALSTTRPPD